MALTGFDKALLAALLGPVIVVATSWLNGGSVVWPQDYIAAVVAGIGAGLTVYFKRNLPVTP